MPRDGRRTADQIAEGIARVCEHIGQIRGTLERGPAGGLQDLGRLLAALSEGTDPSEPLEAVHRALRRAQDAVGVFGHTRDASMSYLAGIDYGAAGEPVLLCPREDLPCARFAWPGTGSGFCHIAGGPLRRTTLGP
ncbi:hypothetical protein O1R50_07845 [Glycomyces luteolus]|uniref:Uncharacterized protein n=1 Tax=Glycomyces luteolus TaxID=2670330 RepID=A0A9X3P7I1_9ACTN|nr:hypothetical protein [Glycomyces luteolus]MDA1359529.1 hypothetical protein [Glycomyces luteolus]